MYTCRILAENTKESGHLQDLGGSGRILIKFICKVLGCECGLDSSIPGKGSVTGICEQGNESRTSIKRGGLLYLKKDSASLVS
jgi:hypothetical protein